MTGYERVSEVLKGNIPDRIPVMMHNFLMAAREAGLTMEEFRSSANHMSMAMIKACQTYELDGIFLDVDTALLASACGARVKYPTDIAREFRSILRQWKYFPRGAKKKAYICVQMRIKAPFPWHVF